MGRYDRILEKIKVNNPKLHKKLTKARNAKTETVEPVASPAEPAAPDADYCALIDLYKTMHPKASAAECLRGINKAVPLAREAFLGKQIKAGEPGAGAERPDLCRGSGSARF